MARLPVLRKRRSKREQALDDLAKRYAKAVVIIKTAPAGTRVAIQGAKHYSTARWSTARKRSKARLIAIPVAVAGGVVILRKVRSGDDDADAGRPLGPVASADTVSPPPATTEAAERAEAQRAEADAAQAHAS